MRSTDNPPTEFLATFSRQRQQLLAHAGKVFPDQPAPDSTDPNVLTLGQCLATSFEELKVAEEEMLHQQLELLTVQAEAERKIAYFRTLFDLAPAPLMLTTGDGVICASNAALANLLTRDVYHLEGKPFAAIVNQAMRADFRMQLKRVLEAGGVNAWSLVLDRKTREPIRVEATIQLVPTALTGAMAMYWSLRAEEPSATRADG